MKKAIIIFSLVSILYSLQSCFSTYPLQKKKPCQETSIQEKLDIIKEAYNSMMKPKNLQITKEGVTIGKRSYNFEEIKYVRVQKKPGALYIYQRYWIQIREFNGDMNVIPLRDHSLVVKVNNALMCLANLHATNGRPPNINSTPNNKYDDLKKLKDLFDDGAITKAEYEIEKKKILDKY